MRNPFKNTQKNREQEQYMNFAANVALPALKKGNLAYVKALLRVFTIREAKYYHIEISNVFSTLLAQTSVKNLMRFDETCRNYIYEEYIINWQDIDWKSLKLSRKNLSYLSDEQYVAVLRFGTFHSNGYFRQMCMEELAQYPDNLPFFVLRLNDWVKEIRTIAYRLTANRIHVCSIQELFSALPMFDKVKNSGRRDSELLSSLENQMKEQINDKFNSSPLNPIHTYDITVKNSIYRFANRNQVLELHQMEQLCSLEKNGYGKRLLILGIFKQFDCTDEILLRYLSDKSGIIRYHALDYCYTKRKSAWPGLEHMLMDKSKRIRDNVCFILKKHSDFDVLEYYKQQLQKQESVIAILGIGENGSRDELKIIQPYLTHDNECFVKAALESYGNISLEQGEAVYWKYLLHSSVLISKQAYRLIKRFGIHYGSDILYEAYLKHQTLPVADDLIFLLTKEASWSRLPYLLLLYGLPILSEKSQYYVRRAVQIRNAYAKIAPEQEQHIRQILEQKRGNIPENLYHEILFDLKYVVRN